MSQIIPIKELKNTSKISDMCHKADEPIYITKNGYGEMFEHTMRKNLMYQDVEISEKQIEKGRTKDAKAALAELRKKYDV